jgi:hypothetical protein
MHDGTALPTTFIAVSQVALVEKLNTAVRDTVRTGWSMFYPFTRPEIRPQSMVDPAFDILDKMLPVSAPRRSPG